jgi:hypothetical protein
MQLNDDELINQQDDQIYDQENDEQIESQEI